MTHAHQVTAGVLAGPDQIPGRLLGHGRHPHRDDVVQAQQPASSTASRASVLTRSPDGRVIFDGAATSQRIPVPVSARARPKPVGPAS